MRSILLAAMLLAFGVTEPVFAGPKGCPPGLAKKSPACVPPGHAKKGGDDWERDRVVTREVVLENVNPTIVRREQPGPTAKRPPREKSA